MIATRVLERVERVQAFADLSLHHALSGGSLSVEDRALATELVYGTLRWRGRLDFLLSHVLDRRLDRTEPLVASTLRLGAYQIVFSDRIANATAVDQSVRCIRALGIERAAGLVNAALRRLSVEHEKIPVPDLVRDPVGHLVHGLSLPRWIAERWLALYGAENAAALATVSNANPPVTLRANREKNTANELLDELLPRFPDAHLGRYSPDAVILGRRGNAAREPAFREGRCSVQDEAAQLVVDLLDPKPGESILDCCAAPGSKTTGIAERVGPNSFVLAVDRHANRLGLVSRAARRLGLENIQTLARDATQPLGDLPHPPSLAPGFDRVLVDAPCSGLGTLRRHPDARWRVRPEDLSALREIQLALLRQCAETLRPAGILVYSTCTLIPEENEDVVNELLEHRKDLRRAPRERIPEALHPLLDDVGDLRCLPHQHGTDGFFAARLERIS